MPIPIHYDEALRMFFNHLRKRNVSEKQIQRVEQPLQHSIKRMIARELTVYPLNLMKINAAYSREPRYKFKSAFNRFTSFLHNNPDLQQASFHDALKEMEKQLSHLSTGRLINIKLMILRIVKFDVGEVAVQLIPETVIHTCMTTYANYPYLYGRGFFRFLIHRGFLPTRYLPRKKSRILEAIQGASESIRKPLTIEQGYLLYARHLWKEKCLQESAVLAKYYQLNIFSRFVGPQRSVCTISQEDVLRYLRDLELNRSYNCDSRATALGTVRRFFAFFLSSGTIKHNPTTGIRVKKVEKIDKTVLSEEELALIFKEAYMKYLQYEEISPLDSRSTYHRWMAARDWAIISVLICTGIRAKEMAALRTDSVDLRKRILKIDGKGDHTYYRMRQRVIPITEPTALAALEIYLKLRPESIFPHLFLASQQLQPLTVVGFWHVLRKIKIKLFPDKPLTITQIRKSFISLCAQKGLDPLILKQIMGHNSMATTMKYYLSVQQQYLKEVWEKNNPLLYYSQKEWEGWLI